MLTACHTKPTAPKATGAIDSLLHSSTIAPYTQKIEQSQTAANYYNRGLILAELNNYSLALLDFNKAIEKDSTQSEYYSAIAHVYSDNKDVTSSVPYLEKAIALNPQDVEARLQIATMLLYSQDYNKSLQQINTVLRKDVFNAEAYFLKGMIFKELKDTAKSISSFQTAIQQNPQYYDAMMQIGQLYSIQKNTIALQYFKTCAQIDTLSTEPLYATAMYHQNNKDYQKAKETYRQCIYVNTQFAAAYYNTGFILIQQDSLQQAYKQFDYAIKVAPTYSAAYYNRGLCSEGLGNLPEAITDYKQALVFNPDFELPKNGLKRLKAQ
jgi:tetratricopeptide (TPR) repeat protein